MTTIEVINKETFEEKYFNKTGSLVWANDWYNCLHYVDKKVLRKNIKNDLPKGAKILKVLITTSSNPNHINIMNKLIPYSNPVCVDKNQDGAYYKIYPEMDFGMYAADFPVGNAIIVIN